MHNNTDVHFLLFHLQHCSPSYKWGLGF